MYFATVVTSMFKEGVAFSIIFVTAIGKKVLMKYVFTIVFQPLHLEVYLFNGSCYE
jgi:hypothetical protein